MENIEIVTLVLDELNVYYDDIARHSYGKLSAVTYGDLILAHITGDLGILGISKTTLSRTTKQLFPNTGMNGGSGGSWKYYFLSLIKHKNCGKCCTIKPFCDFFKDNSLSLGITTFCKDCRKNYNKDSYKKYPEAYKKSLDKNKIAIQGRNALYRAERANRTVSWTQVEEITEFYKNRPDGYHVDHIIPLKGVTVSGLHVIENLQYLTAEENLQKGNRMP